MLENHKTKLVLFDLDGTLIDTAPDFLMSLNNVLNKLTPYKLNKYIDISQDIWLLKINKNLKYE